MHCLQATYYTSPESWGHCLLFCDDNDNDKDTHKDKYKDKDEDNDKDKVLKDPSHAIFLESREFKDIRYDAYNDKDNGREKDNDNDNDKDKDKDKSAENINICYIFEKLRIQGYQIW